MNPIDNHNLAFGGGATATTMYPLVILAVLAGAIAIVFANRRTAIAIFLPLIFLVPSTEQIYLGGLHLYPLRILALAGILRLIRVRISASQKVYASRFGVIDTIFLAWALWRGTAMILDYGGTGIVIGQIAFWIDTIGGYLLLRHLIQSREDVIWTTKVLAVLVSFLAVCFAYESATRVDLFSYIATSPIIPWLRDGKPRAQGPFANSITAGVFGAVLVPLFYWLWRFGNAKILGLVAIFAAGLSVIFCLASTGALAYAGAILALALWPARAHLRKMRWGIVLGVVLLALVMKAPIWYLIAKVNVVGGSHGWARAFLLQATMQHFSSWWLIGTQSRATWGYSTWDACNQFVLEATDGGLAALLLFMALLTACFSLIGRARKRVSRDRSLNWFYWCVGAALFANLMAFIGVDYFDQTFVEWLVFLAMVTAVTQPLPLQKATAPAAKRQLAGVRHRKPYEKVYTTFSPRTPGLFETQKR